MYFWLCMYFLSLFCKQILGLNHMCLPKNCFYSLNYKLFNYFYAIAFLCVCFFYCI